MKHVIFSYSHMASGSSGSWMCVFPSVKSILCLITQSCPTLCDPMDIALQAPLSMGFSRQEYWSRCVPCPPPGDLSNPGIEPRSPALQADSLLSEPPGKPKVWTTRGLNWGRVLSLPLDYAMDHVCRMEPVKAEVPRIYESQCGCVCVCVCVCVCMYAHCCLTLQPDGLKPARFLCSRNFPDKKTGAGCHFLLQRIFLTQRSNMSVLYLLHWQAGSLSLAPPIWLWI